MAQTKHARTVTEYVAADPAAAAGRAPRTLLAREGPLHDWWRGSETERRAQQWIWTGGAVHPKNAAPSTKEQQEIRARFGYAEEGAPGAPSALYIQMLADAVLSLPAQPMSGVVSPPLLASTGAVPLSIFSTGPDIIQHYYDCIVAAEKEVILLTNYWQRGANVDRIADALRELNRRCAERGTRIVAKIMWDRGPRTIPDLFRRRKPVAPSSWASNGVPAPHELSHVDLEILNYHRPLMGTFHAKLLLIDRRVALLNSNNIQDRPNLEACVHLEGDIVNAVYDHALISWGLRLRPALPCIGTPAVRDVPAHAFATGDAETTLPSAPAATWEQRAITSRDRLRREDQASEREQREQYPLSMRMRLVDVAEYVLAARAGATDSRAAPQERPVDGVAAARRAASVWASKTAEHRRGASDTPRISSARLLGVGSSWNVAAEVNRGPRCADLAAARARLEQITSSLDFANLSHVRGQLSAETIEQSRGGWEAQQLMGLLDFEPFLFHAPHKPVPMALVNRRPYGPPVHADLANPQAGAWLAAFRYAQHYVFLQSPTMNAAPVRAAVLAAVRRGVRVEVWLDLGFNDRSESMPFQGGTNEQVVTRMYGALRREGRGCERNLEVYWYTGKDMDRPLNAVRKQRNCHVKFLAVDGQVAILGSGNQDTQSWYHSQEINVMVDSKAVVSEWTSALRRNQSTHIYGRVDQRDGVWRGRAGDQVADTGRDKEAAEQP